MFPNSGIRCGGVDQRDVHSAVAEAAAAARRRPALRLSLQVCQAQRSILCVFIAFMFAVLFL